MVTIYSFLIERVNYKSMYVRYARPHFNMDIFIILLSDACESKVIHKRGNKL
jgi:hypothetical protein